jgi:predicted helicase
MTPLQKILSAYRATTQTEREKGTYFEELIRTYPVTTDAKRLAEELKKRQDAQHMSVVFSTYDCS